MTVTWTIEIFVPAGAADALEAALAPFCEALSGFEMPDQADIWQILGYAPRAPDHRALTAALAVAAATAGVPPPEPRVLPLAPTDWLAENRQSFDPVRAGRYFVYGSFFEAAIPAGCIPIKLDAGPAFGTGTHETTRGCLLALDELAAQGWRPERILDVGTGSGILAIAAARTWPALGRGAIVASDIDPVAARIAAANAAQNGVGAQVDCRVAAGLGGLVRRRPSDLVFANILAGPLVGLAGDLTGALAPGGYLVLSGLLKHQTALVDAAYRARRLSPLRPLALGDWTVLRYRRPARTTQM